jgi:hypothetical protein
MKKNSSLDQELKRTPKDKTSVSKKKSEPLNIKNFPVNTMAKDNAMQVRDGIKKDLKINTPMAPKSKRSDTENSKILRSSEILIEDYRDVLQHSFKNLSTQDPNFSKAALFHDENIERKVGISFRNLPQQSKESFAKDIEYSDIHSSNTQPQSQSDWMRQKPMSIPSTLGTASQSQNSTHSPHSSAPILVMPNRTQSNVSLKSAEVNSPSIQPMVTNQPVNLGGPFQPVLVKPRILQDSRPPEIRNSPQMKNFRNPSNPGNILSSPSHLALESPLHLSKSSSDTLLQPKPDSKNPIPLALQKNPILDKIINSDEGININYYNIFNSMEQQSAEKIKKPGTASTENSNDKPFIKKNNIILTHNSLPNS